MSPFQQIDNILTELFLIADAVLCASREEFPERRRHYFELVAKHKTAEIVNGFQTAPRINTLLAEARKWGSDQGLPPARLLDTTEAAEDLYCRLSQWRPVSPAPMNGAQILDMRAYDDRQQCEMDFENEIRLRYVETAKNLMKLSEVAGDAYSLATSEPKAGASKQQRGVNDVPPTARPDSGLHSFDLRTIFSCAVDLGEAIAQNGDTTKAGERLRRVLNPRDAEFPDGWKRELDFADASASARQALLTIGLALSDLRGNPQWHERGKELLSAGVWNLWDGLHPAERTAVRSLLARTHQIWGWPIAADADPAPFTGQTATLSDSRILHFGWRTGDVGTLNAIQDALLKSNYWLEGFSLADGKMFDIYRLDCKAVKGSKPSICPNALPKLPVELAPPGVMLAHLESRYRSLKLIGDGETIHWVGRQATVETHCVCDVPKDNIVADSRIDETLKAIEDEQAKIADHAGRVVWCNRAYDFLRGIPEENAGIVPWRIAKRLRAEAEKLRGEPLNRISDPGPQPQHSHIGPRRSDVLDSLNWLAEWSADRSKVADSSGTVLTALADSKRCPSCQSPTPSVAFLGPKFICRVCGEYELQTGRLVQPVSGPEGTPPRIINTHAPFWQPALSEGTLVLPVAGPAGTPPRIIPIAIAHHTPFASPQKILEQGTSEGDAVPFDGPDKKAATTADPCTHGMILLAEAQRNETKPKVSQLAKRLGVTRQALHANKEFASFRKMANELFGLFGKKEKKGDWPGPRGSKDKSRILEAQADEEPIDDLAVD